MKKFLFLIIFSLLGVFSSAQESMSKTDINIDQFIPAQSAYSKDFGDATLVAFANYPTLSKENIEFRMRPIKASMDAKPKFWSIFKKPANRKYLIRVNNRSTKHTGFIPADLDFNEKVGLISHELGHIAFYQTRTPVQLLKDGFSYVFSKKYRQKFERETDMRAIEHGAGRQLLQLRKFLWENEKVTKFYKRRQEVFYVAYPEMKEIVK